MKVKKVDVLKCEECEERIENASDIEEVTAYKADDGAELSEDIDDVVEEVTAFKCPSCAAISEDKNELFVESDGWECGECGEIYDDRSEAVACCK